MIARFSDIEKITAVRTSLLDTVSVAQLLGGSGVDSDVVNTVRVESQLQLSARARQAGQLQVSINATTFAQKLSEGLPLSPDVSREFASVLWLREEHGLAIELLRRLLSPNTLPDDPLPFSSVLPDLAKAELLSLLVRDSSLPVPWVYHTDMRYSGRMAFHC